DRLNRAYRDIRPGDRYTLTYLPGRGTTLRLNDTELVTIEGADFAGAYFRIWLGDDPISPALRDQLLGR
ncbi:MAG: chalcone isomerase family protein, partial [Verrucomicrobiota bacterium]